MGAKTKKIRHAGRFGVGYGKIKQRLIAVESLQRKKQKCPFCKGNAKRQARGIWKCFKCGKKFAGEVYYLKEKA